MPFGVNLCHSCIKINKCMSWCCAMNEAQDLIHTENVCLASHSSTLARHTIL